MAFESVNKVAEADFPTRWGNFRIMGFEGVLPGARPCGENNDSRPCDGERSQGSDTEASRENSAAAGKSVEGLVALVMGDVNAPPPAAPPIVRIHSQCLTGDVFGSLRCDCRLQLELALGKIAVEGAGILLYEQQEGRGIGLMAKLKAYELQDKGLDTVEANVELGFAPDCRAYGLPAEVLKMLGVPAVRLITNNPEKVAALEAAGIRVTERVSAEVAAQDTFERYLRTKQEKMGHILDSISDALVGEE